MKKTILVGLCILLLIGCDKERVNPTYIPLENIEDIDKEPEIDCGLIEIWNESSDCVMDYCEKMCWIPYELEMYTYSESNYDFNNDGKITPDERFILDQNIKSANECTKECLKYPYGCFDYVIDARCETDFAVDKINITTGEIIKWKPK